jgi:hypothetical protein
MDALNTRQSGRHRLAMPGLFAPSFMPPASTLKRLGALGLAAMFCPGSVELALAAPELAPFTRYEVTLKIPEVSGTTKYLPAGVSETGQVFGSVAKQAGKVWKWVKPSCNVDPFGLCGRATKLGYTQYVNVYPAVWKDGVATTLPPYGGTYATWITGMTAAGDYVVNASASPGKYPDKVADSTINVPGKQARLLSATGQYGEPFNSAAEGLPYALLRHEAGWLAVQKGAAADGTLPITESFKGANVNVAIPPGATNYRLYGLAKDGALLISVWNWGSESANGESGRPNCFLSRQGVLTPVNIQVAQTILGSNCGRLEDDGTVLGEVTVADTDPSLKSNTHTAIFAWKGGQTELLTPYIADMYRDTLSRSLPALDPVAYAKVGLLVRIEVGDWGLYRDGVTVNALKSAGITLAAGDRSELVGFNSAGQLLIKIVAVSKGSISYALLSPVP